MKDRTIAYFFGARFPLARSERSLTRRITLNAETLGSRDGRFFRAGRFFGFTICEKLAPDRH